jgi:homoserine kinase
MSPASSVTVRVPASTSNCGSGFDSLGLALRLHNRVTLTRRGDDAIHAERPEDGRAAAMVEEAVQAFRTAVPGPTTGFSYRIDGEVPAARGLGSSVTVLAGVVAGLNAFAGSPLSRHDLVGLVTALEGHPDNASAGVLGGFCAARCDAAGRYVDTVRVAVPDHVVAVVVSPAHEIATKESRGALPAVLPFFDAVKSVNSAVYLTAAFATGDFAKLRGAVQDYFHEPYRLPKIPGARAAIEAGIAAGALTGWLSGSGSSVLCLCERAQAEAAAGAMAAAFAAAGIATQTRQLVADNDGLQVEPAVR